MKFQETLRPIAHCLLRPFLVTHLFVAFILLNPIPNRFNVYAKIGFDPNKYDITGKSEEECRKDLRTISQEFNILRDHLNKLLKEEGDLYHEILKERKEGVDYLKKHNLMTNYISHTTAEFRGKLERILKNYGLPFEVTEEQLAEEWKAQNRLTDSVKSLKEKLCALKSKISSVSERNKYRAEIDQLTQNLSKEKQSIEKLYSNTIELMKLNTQIFKEEADLSKAKDQLEEYYEGVVRVGKLLYWNFEGKYRQLWANIRTTEEKAKKMELGFQHMVDAFKISKDGIISSIPDDHFVSSEWAYGTEKLPVILMRIRTEEADNLNKDAEINNVYSIYFQIKQVLGTKNAVVYPAEIPIRHKIYDSHKKAREDWKNFRKIKKRSGQLLNQYKFNVKTAKKFLDEAKQCLQDILNNKSDEQEDKKYRAEAKNAWELAEMHRQLNLNDVNGQIGMYQGVIDKYGDTIYAGKAKMAIEKWKKHPLYTR